MPNSSYLYSANVERKVKAQLEEEGWYAVRAAGSKGKADVIAIRPDGDEIYGNYEVRFIQIKTSKTRKNFKINYVEEQVPFGKVKIEMWMFPHKSNKKKGV